MRIALPTSLFMLMFTAVIPGQMPSQPCPTISVSGPAGTSLHGEPIPYSVQIIPAEKAAGLSYLWSVVTRKGEVGMVRGQGTTQIEVPYTEDSITATVKVIGLPDGCPNMASETASFDPPPMATKLDEMAGPISKLPGSLFDSVRQQIKNNPAAQLFVVVAPGKSGTVKSKIAALKKRLAMKASGLYSRETYVISVLDNDAVAFWIVPAGAIPPDK